MVILKKDDLKFGVIIGLLGPLIGFFGYYFWKFSMYSMSDFLVALRQNKPLVTALTITCLLVNIGLFTLFINLRKDQTARGIFVVTLLVAVGALLFKIWG
jgi:hypothetical protein